MNPLVLLGLVGVGAYFVLRPSSAAASTTPSQPSSVAAAQQAAAQATAAQAATNPLAWNEPIPPPNPAAYGPIMSPAATSYGNVPGLLSPADAAEAANLGLSEQDYIDAGLVGSGGT